MTDVQIEQAARLWNIGCDSIIIAKHIFRSASAPAEAMVYRMLWRGIIARAIALRHQ